MNVNNIKIINPLHIPLWYKYTITQIYMLKIYSSDYTVLYLTLPRWHEIFKFVYFTMAMLDNFTDHSESPIGNGNLLYIL